MKVKLLKKIRSRIVSVEFCNKIYANIEFYNRNDEFWSYSVFGKRDLLFLIRRMFGGFFADAVERKNNRTSLKRLKKKINSAIKYSWEEDK